MFSDTIDATLTQWRIATFKIHFDDTNPAWVIGTVTNRGLCKSLVKKLEASFDAGLDRLARKNRVAVGLTAAQAGELRGRGIQLFTPAGTSEDRWPMARFMDKVMLINGQHRATALENVCRKRGLDWRVVGAPALSCFHR